MTFSLYFVLAVIPHTFALLVPSKPTYNIPRLKRQAQFPDGTTNSPLPESTVLNSTTCPTTSFLCPLSQKCIPNQWVCDYQPDCSDGEDEQQNCSPPVCKKGEFACGDYSWNQTYCVPKHYRCDQVQDCPDKSDERDCKYRECSEEDFKCGSGLCIPSGKKCNGYLDCRDGSDEAGCKTLACNLDQLRCKDGNGCIEKHRQCNHRKDCEDGSDEKNCYFPSCQEDQIRCENGLCIPRRWRCDSFIDCADASDEMDCQPSDCSEEEFLCKLNNSPDNIQAKCIPNSKLCDAIEDCHDGADEKVSNCSNDQCGALQCEYKCRPSPQGGICLCPEGKMIAKNGELCEDYNECTDWGSCDQFCTNTEGSYKCFCEIGFQLNGTKCLAENTESLRLYYAHQTKILRLNPQNSQNLEVIANTTAASGIDYHHQREMFFWSDTDTRKVYGSKLNDQPGTAVLSINLNSLWMPVAVAIDWIGDNVYVVDQLGQKIDIFDIEGRYHAIVVGFTLSSPRDIALDPSMAYMFIADEDRLVRLNMDGTQYTALVTDIIHQATGVTVDITSKRVFFCDSLLHYIETVDYQGERRFPVLRGSNNVVAPSRLATFERSIYWTDAFGQGVFSVDKFDGQDSAVSKHQDTDITGDPKAIKAVHPLLQPQLATPCGANRSMCEHICLLTRNAGDTNLGYRCGCQVGYYLRADKMKCTPVQEFLVYSQKRFIKGQVLDSEAESMNDAILPIVSRTALFIGLDFDYRDQKIYYSDIRRDTIYRANWDGTGQESFLVSRNEGDDGRVADWIKSNEGVGGLALDWVSKNLYYVDSMKATLNVLSTVNTGFRRTLLGNLTQPRAIAVHPNRGYIFFSEVSRPANISRVHSDGTNVEVLKNLLLGWPNGLSIDYDTDRLYWVDALLDHIQHANLDGTDVKTITNPKIRHPFSLVIFKDYLYVTDWYLDGIVRLNKLAGTDEKIVTRVHRDNRLYGIKVYAQWNQKVNPDHPCKENNGGCDNFCFPMPSNNTASGLVAKCMPFQSI